MNAITVYCGEWFRKTAIRNVSEATLRRDTEWCNTLPCKILTYLILQEAFLKEVKKLAVLENVQFHIAI